MRRFILAFGASLVVLAAATTVAACASVVPADRLPGETDAQLVARARQMRQADLRQASDSVYLAQVSAGRLVDSFTAEYSFEPFFPLYGEAPPADPLTMRSHLGQSSCDVQPELGGIFVVYAKRTSDGWQVHALVRHVDLQDRPPGAPSARDFARGATSVPLPRYSDSAVPARPPTPSGNQP